LFYCEEAAFVISFPNSLGCFPYASLAPVAVKLLSLGIFLLFSLFPLVEKAVEVPVDGTDWYPYALFKLIYLNYSFSAWIFVVDYC